MQPSSPDLLNTIIGVVGGLLLSLVNWWIGRKHISENENLREELRLREVWLKEVYLQLDDCLNNKSISEEKQ